MTDGERLVALLGKAEDISKTVARIEVDGKADVARLDDSIAKTRAFVGSQTDDLHTRLNAISERRHQDRNARHQAQRQRLEACGGPGQAGAGWWSPQAQSSTRLPSGSEC